MAIGRTRVVFRRRNVDGKVERENVNTADTKWSVRRRVAIPRTNYRSWVVSLDCVNSTMETIDFPDDEESVRFRVQRIPEAVSGPPVRILWTFS